jgi:hypothetical protein
MLLKSRELSNKEKLRVVLNHFCYSYIDPEEAKKCKGCSYYTPFYHMIMEASDRIKAAPRRGRVNYIIVAPEVAAKIKELLKNE